MEQADPAPANSAPQLSVNLNPAPAPHSPLPPGELWGKKKNWGGGESQRLFPAGPGCNPDQSLLGALCPAVSAGFCGVGQGAPAPPAQATAEGRPDAAGGAARLPVGKRPWGCGRQGNELTRGNNVRRRERGQRGAAGRSAEGKDGAASPGPSVPAPRGRCAGPAGEGAPSGGETPWDEGRQGWPMPKLAPLLRARGKGPGRASSPPAPSCGRGEPLPPPLSTLRICLTRGEPRRPAPRVGAGGPSAGRAARASLQGQSLGADTAANPPPRVLPSPGEAETRGSQQRLLSPHPAGGERGA